MKYSMPGLLSSTISLSLPNFIPRDSQESSPTQQFESINSPALCLPYGPALTAIRCYRENHSFDYTIHRQGDYRQVDRLGVWSHTGFANLSCLTKAAARHQITAGHLQATVLLKTFGETRVDLQLNEQMRRETELHNEKVKKYRDILKRLIDCVIFLGKQELSFRGHDESAGSTNRGNYLELLSFLAENNTDLHYHLSTNKVFCGTSGTIQNDLINAIAEVMGEEIKREIKKAPFVAVMVDETTDASNAAQLALVLRYVTDTGVKERFVKFEDVTSGKRADDIAALISKTLDVQFCLARVNEFCDTIERERGQFGQIYEATARIAGAPSARRGPAQGDLRAHYHQLHSTRTDQGNSQSRRGAAGESGGPGRRRRLRYTQANLGNEDVTWVNRLRLQRIEFERRYIYDK
ncbi:unnamed protein product [Leuciscus chuanchicus]